MSLSRKQRLVENEVIFRDVNKNIGEFVAEENGSTDKPVPFYCECSSPTCVERINLTPRRYKQLHQSSKHFIIIAGHDYPEIEQVISKYDGYQVVEKHLQPPKAKDIELALKSIETSPKVA